MAGQITYRLALDSDINRINEFYNKVYKKNRTYEQFYWEYNSAPAGKAIYVIAECDGQVVGTQCAIPMYTISHDNKESLTAKLEDVLVSPDHRGRNIFGSMYQFSIEECRRQNMVFIWGFAYLNKEYKKIGFDIPYKNTMGFITLDPVKSARYFYSLTATKNTMAYAKILGLSYYSYFKFGLLGIGKKPALDLQVKEVEYNGPDFNYIKYKDLYGLKLDKAFIDYRINTNPYSKNYKTVSWYKDGALKASMVYNITKQNVGFIIHVYFDNTLSEKESSEFVKQVILSPDLKKCILIRFWGFTHNAQNAEEVALLKKNHFIFLDRGISFVGLRLKKDVEINFSNFVLSRMASQGTD